MNNPMSRFAARPRLEVVILCSIAVAIFAMVGIGGCSSSSTPGPSNSPHPSPTPTVSVSPTPSPSPTPTPVNFVILAYASIAPTNDPTYGKITGYAQASAAPSPTPLPSVVSSTVTVHCNQTIEFYNLDRTLTTGHTASLMGTASGMNWPPYFNNVNGVTASPLLTAITGNSFSTGILAPFGSGFFSNSLVYSTGPTAGSFYFGDYYDYLPVIPGNPQMRTVITVVCP